MMTKLSSWISDNFAGAQLQIRAGLNSIYNLARSVGIKINRFRSQKSLKRFQSDETK